MLGGTAQRAARLSSVEGLRTEGSANRGDYWPRSCFGQNLDKRVDWLDGQGGSETDDVVR